MLHATVTTSCLLLTTTFALAQSEALPAAVQPARPGPSHAALARFVGSWELTFEVGDEHGSVRRVATAQAEVAPAYGGFWLVEDLTGTFADVPFRGHGLLGFDPGARACVRTWVDNMGPSPQLTQGKFDAEGNVLTMNGTGADLHGRPAQVHSVFTWRDLDHGDSIVRMTDGDGRTTDLRIGYARRAPATLAQRIARTIALLIKADYRGDLEALTTLRESLPDVTAAGEHADAVHYWRGFATWRRAVNRMNDPGYDRALAHADLEAALPDFDAVQHGPLFADCASAAAGCLMGLMYIDGREHAEFLPRAKHAASLVEAAVAAAPDNPRVLWIQGGRQMWTPGPTGGRERALATFAHGLMAARAEAAAVSTVDASMVAASLLPRWGEPELLAATAFAWSNFEPRDLARAEQLARAALDMRPDWHYAKATLLASILAKQSEK